MRFIYGTGNEHKKNQVIEMLKFKGIDAEILTLKDIGFDKTIIEDGKTFEENSLIKAIEIQKFCNENNIKDLIITDDAGLCVDALNGEPGIYSARYAGDHASQEITLKKLLNNLKNVPEEKRTATFVCVLTLLKPDGKKIVVRGETKGKIASKPGRMGKLTYGPIFIPEGFNKVMNELSDEELGITHREKAFMKLMEQLKEEKI